MKIALLAGLSSIHTVRWANAFAEREHSVHLITSHPEGPDRLHSGVIVHTLPFSAPMGYYLNTNPLKRILKRIKPDVMNVHYASGYGTLARLSGFHPSVLSVWGSDVYDFPNNNRLCMKILRKNILAADVVCSTSHAMAAQTRKICPEITEIHVTPFGVDTNLFKPEPNLRDPRYVTIGTVKTLAPKYGIDTLLRAFAYVFETLSSSDPGLAAKMRLMIVGGGPQEKELKDLAARLKIQERCLWAGRVPHHDVPKYLNQLDIYVALSRLESFGVAILEASACGLPVIVSNVGGLPEVVIDGVTGIVVNKEVPEEAGKAIIKMIKEPENIKTIGQSGLEYIKKQYHWQYCVGVLESILCICHNQGLDFK